MVHALGFSHNDFNPADPGRLCRGRERWIEPYEVEDRPDDIHRLVISGATFTDDSARDALRGLPHSSLPMASVIAALFPDQPLLAFMEDGHPADIPHSADGVELYSGFRAGGLSDEMLVRWYAHAQGEEEIAVLLGPDPQEPKVRGFVQLDGEVDLEELWARLFSLVGMSTLDSPPAQYQPVVLPEVLALVPAVVMMHRDKHGPALGVYARDPVVTEGRLGPVCERAGTLLVPFAIPPMLARWDRALAELKTVWLDTRDEEFPVPPATEPSSWEPRWKRRQRKKRDARDRKNLEQNRESGAEE